MAKVDIKLKCDKCGNEFRHQHYCINRSDAENYKNWAVETITVCPECYKKQQSENIVNEFNLPELKGTEKQINYANNLRFKWIKNDLQDFREIYKKWENSDDEMKTALKNRVNELLPKIRAKYWNIAILALNDAKKIIEIFE